MDTKNICCNCLVDEGTPDGCVTLCPLHAHAEGMREKLQEIIACLDNWHTLIASRHDPLSETLSYNFAVEASDARALLRAIPEDAQCLREEGTT